MCKALAETLGWVPPSERFAKTVERAQKCAWESGAQEILAEHFFSAVLEDLDAIHFLGRHEIPMERLEALRHPEMQPDWNAPRLTAPAHYSPKPVTPPHLEIPASAAVRRIAGLASAIAERRSMAQVHGGIALEAILEDGSWDAAKTLKALHAEVVQWSGRRVAPLPGAGHEGAILLVQAPPREEPKAPRALRQHGYAPLQQVRWLKDQIESALSRESPYRLFRELGAFAGNDSPFTSMAALQLRGETQASLDTNPAYVVLGELQSAESAVEAANAQVRRAALRVADIRPEIFNGLLALVADAAAVELKNGLEARRAERAAAAASASTLEAQACQTAAQPHCLVQLENKAANISVVTASWSKVPPQSAADKDETKKSAARFGRFLGSVAAARATMMNLFA